jgi:hypothetical protein
VAATLPTIPRLAFAVLGAEPVEHAAVPSLRFDLRVDSVSGHDVRSVLLDVQVRIAARRRPYAVAEQKGLFDLFGPAKAWGTSLQSLQWTRTTLVVPPFEQSTVVGLPVTCTYDLEVAAARYFDALEGGDVPLEFLFSGSVFYTGAGGMLQTARISWEEEAEFRMPVRVWKATMERHFPGAAWVRLGRESFDRLSAYRTAGALPGWDAAVDALLAAADPGTDARDHG